MSSDKLYQNLAISDTAVVTIRPQKSLSTEPSNEIPEFGSFAIRDMGQTIAAGKVLEITEGN